MDKLNPRAAIAVTVAVLAGAAAIATPAAAQSGADFFKGKTVTYIVATAPGGGYDFYGRLVTEAMQRYLPGSTFVVRNMPGAGHIIGANAIYASRADGLTLGTFNTGLIYNQLVGLEGVKFDLAKMSWIGKAAADPRVFVITKDSPIQTYDDLKKSAQVNFATSGVGSASYVETKILADSLHLPIKIITGYNGNDDQMAMRRGEIVGIIGSRSSFDDFKQNGYGKYIVQIGGNEKDIPQLSTLVDTPEGKSMVALIQSQSDLSRFTAGPPAIPAERLATLRAAYKSAMEDKDLQAKALKGGRPIEAAYGDDLANLVKEAMNQSPETVKLLAAALDAKPSEAKASGPLLDVADKGSKITFAAADGKKVTASPSGSRTKIMIAGKEAKRDDLKAGLNCEITYKADGDMEPSNITCK
ncbi:MAG TPA: tripartite tricarboxylate transporter substrate-binding protein [Alphaproteobacteria bacterium]|jgi:tripartite-type tricarboxylate transporter receptor subunit TctC